MTQVQAPSPTTVMPIRRFAGGFIYRLINFDGATVGEHRHDELSITVPLRGVLHASYCDVTPYLGRGGVIVHPPGEMHGGTVGWTGFEAVEVELDPDWLAYAGLRETLRETQCMSGRHPGSEALVFAQACVRHAGNDVELAGATRRFFTAASTYRSRRMPDWLESVRDVLLSFQRVSTSELAKMAGVSRQRLCESYQFWFGESLQSTARGNRIDAATIELRHSTNSLADIACRAGFYDQSHMNRVFMRTIGRTPLQVRRRVDDAMSA